jgi:plasmid stabilization system protein ParE
MSGYVLSSEALLELDEIWGFIAQDDIEAADRWIARLLDACEMLARNPRAGHLRKDLTKDFLLFWPVGAYLIIYRMLEDAIEIVAVTQGARDIPSYLRRRP